MRSEVEKSNYLEDGRQKELRRSKSKRPWRRVSNDNNAAKVSMRERVADKIEYHVLGAPMTIMNVIHPFTGSGGKHDAGKDGGHNKMTTSETMIRRWEDSGGGKPRLFLRRRRRERNGADLETVPGYSPLGEEELRKIKVLSALERLRGVDEGLSSLVQFAEPDDRIMRTGCHVQAARQQTFVANARRAGFNLEAVRGYTNCRMTCYVITILQCFSFIPQLIADSHRQVHTMACPVRIQASVTNATAFCAVCDLERQVVVSWKNFKRLTPSRRALWDHLPALSRGKGIPPMITGIWASQLMKARGFELRERQAQCAYDFLLALRDEFHACEDAEFSRKYLDAPMVESRWCESPTCDWRRDVYHPHADVILTGLEVTGTVVNSSIPSQRPSRGNYLPKQAIDRFFQAVRMDSIIDEAQTCSKCGGTLWRQMRLGRLPTTIYVVNASGCKFRWSPTLSQRLYTYNVRSDQIVSDSLHEDMRRKMEIPTAECKESLPINEDIDAESSSSESRVWPYTCRAFVRHTSFANNRKEKDHYVCFGRNFFDDWFKADDEQVNRVRFLPKEEFLDAYIMIYSLDVVQMSKNTEAPKLVTEGGTMTPCCIEGSSVTRRRSRC